MYCTSSRRGSTSFWCVSPFTVTLIVFFMEPPLCAAWELLDVGHTKCFEGELPHWFRAIPAITRDSGDSRSVASFSVSPCLRGRCLSAFICINLRQLCNFGDLWQFWHFWQCHYSPSSLVFFRPRPSRCNRSNSVFSSITSSGHSGQLCSQHTIKSHLLGSCRCDRKFRLYCSNSISTRCHTPGATSRMASQSGKPICICVTRNPRSSAMAPNRNSTPCSFIGPCASGTLISGGP